MRGRLVKVAVAIALGAVLTSLLLSTRTGPAGPSPDGGEVAEKGESVAAPPENRGSVVTGVVRDERGPAAATVTIRSERQDFAQTIEAPEGRFVVQDIERGAYVFSARTKSGVVVWKSVSVEGSNASVELVLQDGVKLDVSVVDAEGVAVEGAEVEGEAVGSRVFALVTESTGAATATLPGGEYTVYATHRGARSMREEVFLDGAQSIVLRLPRTAELRGRVLFDGNPVPEAEVAATAEGGEARLRSWPTKTDAKGEFAIAGLNPTDYTLRARQGNVVAIARHVLAVPELAPFVELHATAAATVVGRVRRAKTSVFGAERPVVSTRDGSGTSFGGRQVAAAEDGSFRIEGLFPGRVMLTARWGAETGGEVATLLPGQTVQANIDLEAPENGTIDVECVDSTGRAIEGATVTTGFRDHCVTDRAGRCRLDIDVPSTTEREIDARSVGHGIARSTVTVGPGKISTVRLSLEPWASVDGHVAWTDGTPAIGVYVVTMSRSTRTDASGNFRLRGVDPRETILGASERAISRLTLLTAEALAAPGTTRGISLRPGERATVELRLQRKTATVSGTVVDATGAPVAYAQIGLVPHQPQEHEAADDFIDREAGQSDALFSNADGTFTFATWPSQTYAVWARLPPFPRTVRYDVRAPATRLVVPVSAGAQLDVRVASAGGQPVRSFLISLASEGGERYAHDFRSGADGAYSFSHVAPGRYAVLVRTNGGIASSTVIVDSDKRRTVSEVRLVVPSSTRGRLVSQATREPIADAIVADASDPTMFAVSKADGTFRLVDLLPRQKGALRIHCRTQCDSYEHPISLSAAEDLDLGDVLVP